MCPAKFLLKFARRAKAPGVERGSPMRKATSSKVSKLASKPLHDATPNADVRAAIADAVTGCGIPLNDRATNAVVDRIVDAIEPFLDDVRTLAASCLSQDETPGNDEPPIVEDAQP